MDNWTAVFETTQPFQAELVKGMLCDNGVEAVILNQRDSSYTTFGTIQVMVNKEFEQQAEEILKNMHCE